jgi:hypothetical protein
MIITKKKALSIITSIQAVKNVPELINLYDQYKLLESKTPNKPGCSVCQRNKAMAELEDMALSGILNLSAESINALKKFLAIDEPIYIYVSGPEGVVMKKLGE